MISKDKRWGRWVGYRSDIADAANEAVTAIQGCSGSAPEVTVMVTHADRLTEHTDTLDTVRKLHRDELRGVRNLWLEVKSKGPQVGSVRIRLTRGSGLNLEVWGDDRNSVNGLTQRLENMLGRSAPRLLRFDLDVLLIPLCMVLLLVGVILGPAVSRWVGLGEINDQWDTWEVVGVIVGLALAVLITFGLWRAFPTTELLDQGELSRYRRLRQVIVGGLGALVVGVFGAWLFR